MVGVYKVESILIGQISQFLSKVVMQENNNDILFYNNIIKIIRHCLSHKIEVWEIALNFKTTNQEQKNRICSMTLALY